MMHGEYLDEELFPRKRDKDAFLFDNPEELPTSGNEDPLDSVKHVCLACGRANGEHDSSCSENF